MFSVELARRLVEAGHDVKRASEVGQARADDAEILEQACREERTLITLDQHSGDWVILPLTHHPGVIRIKIHPTTTTGIAELLIPFVEKARQSTLRNQLVILSATNERWIKTSEN